MNSLKENTSPAWLHLRDGVVVGTSRPDYENGRYVYVGKLPSEGGQYTDGHSYPVSNVGETDHGQLAAGVAELSNIANARRFDRQAFRDDTEFADWAQNRCRWAIEKSVAHPIAAEPVAQQAARVDDPLLAHERLRMRAALEAALSAQPAPHPDDAAVDRFAAAMKAKLAAARAKGRGGWQDKIDCPQQRLSDMLRAHVEKGDPCDVANFAMFLHQRRESILPAQPAERQGEADGLLPETLASVSREWYALCERAPHVDHVGISGELARAIVNTVARHPAAPVGAPDEVAKVAKHIALAVEYIEKQWPDAKQLDRGPIIRNMRRWRDRLLAAAPSQEPQS